MRCFFAVFFVFVSAGVLAFFQLNSASEQQALSAQMQASVRLPAIRRWRTRLRFPAGN